jgi:hypothetical protein
LINRREFPAVVKLAEIGGKVSAQEIDKRVGGALGYFNFNSGKLTELLAERLPDNLAVGPYALKNRHLRGW